MAKKTRVTPVDFDFGVRDIIPSTQEAYQQNRFKEKVRKEEKDSIKERLIITRHIFLVGPGNVGKTTVGQILATKLTRPFIDLDQSFMETIGHIGQYIDTEGYATYRQRNSELLTKLLKATKEPVVFALSSGFLVYQEDENEIQPDKNLLAKHGTTILLLPSRNVEDSIELIVKRAMSRPYLQTNPERERKKFHQRFPQYQKFGGDIQIYSTESPDRIAEKIIEQLSVS